MKISSLHSPYHSLYGKPSMLANTNVNDGHSLFLLALGGLFKRLFFFVLVENTRNVNSFSSDAVILPASWLRGERGHPQVDIMLPRQVLWLK